MNMKDRFRVYSKINGEIFLRAVAPNWKVFFLFVPMWDLLLVARAVEIQKENRGSP